jgi:hypothetical protein
MADSWQTLWEDERNWRLGSFYYCVDDPRVVVRGRTPLTAWTLNFAHAGAWFVIFGSFAMIIGGQLLVRLMKQGTTGRLMAATISLAFISGLFAILGRNSD